MKYYMSWHTPATFACSILAVIISAIAITVGGLAYTYYGYSTSPSPIYGSGPLPSTPYAFYIRSSAVPVQIVLPADLTPFVGKVYRIWSLTAQGHTIVIGGGFNYFNGAANTATFGGAIGDGFEFEVISPTFVRVISDVNVVFV